jgi:hypothetical protein
VNDLTQKASDRAMEARQDYKEAFRRFDEAITSLMESSSNEDVFAFGEIEAAYAAELERFSFLKLESDATQLLVARALREQSEAIAEHHATPSLQVVP